MLPPGEGNVLSIGHVLQIVGLCHTCVISENAISILYLKHMLYTHLLPPLKQIFV